MIAVTQDVMRAVMRDVGSANDVTQPLSPHSRTMLLDRYVADGGKFPVEPCHYDLSTATEAWLDEAVSNGVLMAR